jgi:hypothetical protein
VLRRNDPVHQPDLQRLICIDQPARQQQVRSTAFADQWSRIFLTKTKNSHLCRQAGLPWLY